MAPKDILTKDFLEKEFVQNGKSSQQIAKEFGIKSSNSVMQFIKKFNLTRNPNNDYSYLLTEDFLIEEYIIKNKSSIEIAKELEISKPSVLRALKKYKLVRKFTFSKTWSEWPERIRKHSIIPSRYFSDIKSGAKQRNLEFEIDINYVWEIFQKQNGKCVYSGVDLIFPKSGEKSSTQTASLDRIDSSKGYIKGNVQWIYKKLQYLKWDLKEEEFLSWIKIIYENRNLDVCAKT